MNHRTILTTLLLVSVAALASSARGQQNNGLTLDQKLKLALANNPEIQVAEAKVAQAQAEYRIVRLKVTQQVLELHNDLDSQRRLVGSTATELEQTRRMFQAGFQTDVAVSKVEQSLIQAQNRLAQIEAQRRYVLGTDAVDNPRADSSSNPRRRRRPEIPAEFVEHLAIPVEVRFAGSTLVDVIDAFADRVDGSGLQTAMKFVIDESSFSDEFGSLEELTVTLDKGEVTLRSALSMIADSTPVRFVFRDYGILVTTESRVIMMNGATIPSDIPALGSGRE